MANNLKPIALVLATVGIVGLAAGLYEKNVDSRETPDITSESEEQTAIAEGVFDSSVHNIAFRDLTAEELKRFQPRVDTDFYRRGKPNRYKRHRLVKIDVQELRNELTQKWSAASNGGEPAIATIPLFEDAVVDITVTGWQETDMGVSGAFGYLSELPSPESAVSLIFHNAGTLNATIKQQDWSIMIKPLGEDPLHVVESLDPLPPGTTFD